jgi:Tetratricopeptide repeat
MVDSAAPEPRITAQPPSADSGREVADEDFLFHLYRGSELLQDDRVHEAKESLERALTYQPRDAKGQDLLAVVYFRLGLYPRATQIYETLRNQNPREPSLRLNLALCYLKTSQAGRARDELEAIVKAQPEHKRAWGYLGLAYERTGDLARAQEAFDRGGHAHMAKRIAQRGGSLRPSQLPPEPPANEQREVRQAASAAFQELDAGELSFSLAAPSPGGVDAGGAPWRAVEMGTPDSLPVRALQQGERRSEPPPPVKRPAELRLRPTIPAPDTLPGVAPPDALRGAAPPHAAPKASDALAAARLLFPDAPGVVLHGRSGALVTTTDERPFALRLEAIRAFVGPATQIVLERRTRERATGEPLGGVVAPIVKVAGAAGVVVRARAKNVIVAFGLEEAPAYVREEHLLGFDLALTFESGTLSAGDAEAVRVVQLRGLGVVLLELAAPIGAIPVGPSRAVTVRRDAIVGWLGRLVPRVLSAAEAPAGQRGLLSFAGEGTVLVASM